VHGRKGGKPEREDKPRKFEARPPRPEKPIDPDNPFAALMALKGKV
jgi:ATP-dependent RNA helicase SUPV3L1/SUV3